MVVANRFNQDTAAECKAIKRMVKMSKVKIVIKRVNSHKKNNSKF